MQKNTQNILEKLQEKVIMSKMTHLIKYKQIFYQIINENAGDVVNGTFTMTDEQFYQKVFNEDGTLKSQ